MRDLHLDNAHIAQKLPKDLDDKVESFQRFIIRHRKQYDYDLTQIGNMDETPMFFDMPGNTTVAMKGEKTINVRTCGADKTHFTVVLCVMADGTKLTPMVVFKRKTLPKVNVPGVIIAVHPKGWVDEGLVHMFLDQVWNKRPSALFRPQSLLVWDMFRAHLVDYVRKKLNEMKTHVAVIPGGTTSILQPLDVCLNKPFKVNMRKLWNEWMISGEQELTKAGNFKRPSIEKVVAWVKDAWDAVPASQVIISFKKCSISNAMDGSEDHLLYSELISDNSCSDVTKTPTDVDESEDEDETVYCDISTNDLDD